MPYWLDGVLAIPVIGTLLDLLLIFLVFLFIRRALQLAVAHAEKRVQLTVVEADRRNRLHTLLRVGNAIGMAVLGTLALTMALSALGVYIVPVLASAGVVGLAISLGAQTLIRDYISGILILVEDNFRVGEVLEVNGVSGEVVRMTLRVTYMRNSDGRLHAVPNGDIRTLTNASRK